MTRISAALFLLLAAALTAPGAWAAACQPASFDSQRAYRDLVRQCDFGPRVPGTKAHEECSQWLLEQLKGCADEVARQDFTAEVTGKRLLLTNLSATFNPHGAGHILLCAHWDSRPTADHDPDPTAHTQPIPGANDGASGVAVLLAVARALKAQPSLARVTIVLFDGEDYGATEAQMLLGSRHFAAHFAGPPVAWAVLLDMVGDRDLRLPPEQISLQRAGQVVGRLWGAAAREGCVAFVRDSGPAVLDDHVPLLDQGIPCIDIIDFDYPYWHTTADTPDKCSAASLDQVGRTLLRAIAEYEATSPTAR